MEMVVDETALSENILNELNITMSTIKTAEHRLRELAFIIQYGRDPLERELEGFPYKKILREKVGIVV